MGEYAKHNGHEVKIGTCEDMYYLRADQLPLVRAVPNSVNPVADRFELRFRFPWPDEDGIAPGQFEKAFDRSHGLHGVDVPADVEHHKIQFSSGGGYLISLPCPEAPRTKELALSAGLTFHRNGFEGCVYIAQQRPVRRDDGTEVLALICKCGGCGSKYRLDTLAEAMPIITAARPQSSTASSAFWQAVADRIEAGYVPRPSAVSR